MTDQYLHVSGQLLTIDQARSVLPMSKAWYATARCKGTGPDYVKIGSRVFYRRDSLLAFAERHAVSPITKALARAEAGS